MMKKILLICIICIVLGGIDGIVLANQILTFTAQKVDFKIEVDGQETEFEMPVVVIEGRTYLPLREMAETLGIGIEWLEEEQKIVITTEGEDKGAPTTNLNPMKLQLYESYTVDDTSSVRKYFHLREDVPIVGFFQIRDLERLHELVDFLELNLPSGFDFDFGKYPDKWVLMTFGRQLVEIQYEYRESEYDYGVPFTEIVFAEDHNDQAMYIYTMDEIRLWDACMPGWGYNSFYVMTGLERVYIGNTVGDFNKLSPSLVPGL